jgi:hypothetical protein
VSKTSTPADAVAVLTKALSEGHAVTLSLAAPPHVNCIPPLITACRLRFKLTSAEAAVLAELIESGLAEQGVLQAAMSRNGTHTPTAASLRVLVSKIRKKLAIFDVKIGLVWGQGYIVSEGDCVRVRKLLAESATTPAAAPMD